MTLEDIAYQVSKFSLTNKSTDIEVHPSELTELRDKQLYWRDEDKLGSRSLRSLDSVRIK